MAFYLMHSVAIVLQILRFKSQNKVQFSFEANIYKSTPVKPKLKSEFFGGLIKGFLMISLRFEAILNFIDLSFVNF